MDVHRLPEVVGLSRALDAVLTGREILAEEAFKWGLLDKLIEEDENGQKL